MGVPPNLRIKDWDDRSSVITIELTEETGTVTDGVSDDLFEVSDSTRDLEEEEADIIQLTKYLTEVVKVPDLELILRHIYNFKGVHINPQYPEEMRGLTRRLTPHKIS